jgi:cell division septum initiation protein DivIVA
VNTLADPCVLPEGTHVLVPGAVCGRCAFDSGASRWAVETWTKITSEAYEKGGAPRTQADPDVVIDHVFDFAEKMLESQRDLAKKLLAANQQAGRDAQEELELAGLDARTQADQILEAARKQADAVYEAAREQSAELIKVAREQAESIFSNVRVKLAESRPSSGNGAATGLSPSDHSNLALEDDQEVVIYIQTDDEAVAAQVFAAVDELSLLLGYQQPIEESLERGSFFRRAKAHVAAGLSSDAVTDRLTKVERAIELTVIDAKQADVDDKTAQAVQRLISSLADVPQACIRVGSILLVKYHNGYGPVILTRTLSQVEIRALERFPEIQTHPNLALTALATAIESMEVVVE